MGSRDRDRDRKRTRAPKDAGRRIKKRVCIFCQQRTVWIDYKDVNVLRKFMSERGKIRARRVSGNCAQHQRDVAIAIKTARELALLPYTQRSVSERGPRPRRDSGGPPRGPARDERPRPEVSDDASSEAEEPADGGDGAEAVGAGVEES